MCYWPPDEEKTNATIFGSLKQALRQQNLILMGYFKPDEKHTSHMSFIKLLKCVEHYFLIQVLDVPTRNEALLDLLVANQENLLFNPSVSDSFDCSDHNIAEFGILLSTLKVSTNIF